MTPPRSVPTRRSPRASSRSSTCSPRRCRAGACRGTTARSTSGSSRSPTPRSTRGRSSPSPAPAPTRWCAWSRSRGRAPSPRGGCGRDDADRGRPGRRARARARPHQPRPLARGHRARHHPRDPGRRGPAAALVGADEQLLDFFDEDRPEPFFVKNLERVQGDERDDIVLTIGYGKTPHGRVLHRFGPLNIEGGERRLNVAITRARRSMTVVSAIAAEDLDPARLRARGAMMLRDYLAYAAGGPLPGCRRARRPPPRMPRHRLRCPAPVPSCSPTWPGGCAGTGWSCTRTWGLGRPGRPGGRGPGPGRPAAAGRGVRRAAVRRDAHHPRPRPVAGRAARAARLAAPAGVVDRRLPRPGP